MMFAAHIDTCDAPSSWSHVMHLLAVVNIWRTGTRQMLRQVLVRAVPLIPNATLTAPATHLTDACACPHTTLPGDLLTTLTCFRTCCTDQTCSARSALIYFLITQSALQGRRSKHNQENLPTCLASSVSSRSYKHDVNSTLQGLPPPKSQACSLNPDRLTTRQLLQPSNTMSTTVL